MKITSTQYAKTLYELTLDKKHEEINSVVLEFSKVVEKNGQAKLLKGITGKFEDIYNQENNIVKAEVVTKEKMTDDLEKKIKDFVGNKYGAKEVVVENTVDEKIKGGVIVRVGDEIMDGSVSRKLVELKKKLER